MAEECMGCGCYCSKCQANEECTIFANEIARLCKKLNASERRTQELDIELSNIRRAEKDDEEKRDESIESHKEQNKRLRECYDDALQQNQELESRILKIGDELHVERARFDEAMMAMTERLVDTTENMNKMEKEIVKSKKDCALVVQLLQCNQSVDKHFVLQKVEEFPSDLKQKIQGELNWKDISNGVTKPRSKTTSDIPETNSISSTIKPCIRRAFSRSKSVTFSTPLVSKSVVQNGVHK